MNLDKKLGLAHEYAEKLAMNHAVTATNNDGDIVMRAWEYADAMEAECKKRLKEQKDKIYDPMRNVRTKQVPPTVETPPIKIIGGG